MMWYFDAISQDRIEKVLKYVSKLFVKRTGAQKKKGKERVKYEKKEKNKKKEENASRSK